MKAEVGSRDLLPSAFILWLMRKISIAVTTTGSAGAATGTAYSTYPLSGFVVAVKVDWHASAPNTSDITVTSADGLITYVTKSNSNTDAWFYPVVQNTDNAGSAVSGQYMPYPVAERLLVTVGDCDALTEAVVVTVYIED